MYKVHTSKGDRDIVAWFQATCAMHAAVMFSKMIGVGEPIFKNMTCEGACAFSFPGEEKQHTIYVKEDKPNLLWWEK